MKIIKNIFFVLFVFSFVFNIPSPKKIFAISSSFLFNETLSIGSSGQSVSNLQEILKGEGFFNFNTITGYFGQITEDSVKKFQAANNLESVGYVGPLTRSLLNSLISKYSTTSISQTNNQQLNFNRSLYIGLSGSDVSNLQEFLKKLGFYTFPSITGYFGNITKTAVTDFQRFWNIDPIGIVGPVTQAKILELSNITENSPLPSTTPPTSTSIPTVPNTNIPMPTPVLSSPGFGGGGPGYILPQNISAPTISGANMAGDTLTSSSGSWSGTPTPNYTYQWNSNGVAISGATSPSYTITPNENGTKITVTVTATNPAGSASATSAETENIVLGIFNSSNWDDDGYWQENLSWTGPNSDPNLFLSNINDNDSKNNIEKKIAAIIDRYHGFKENVELDTYSDIRQSLNSIATNMSLSTIEPTDTGSSARSKINSIISATNPSMVFDLENDFYYWGGQIRSLSDATDHGDGSYSVNDGSWWNSNGWTFLAEYEPENGRSNPSLENQIFSWTNASNQRFEHMAYNFEQTRTYFSVGNEYAYPLYTGVNNQQSAGRRRVIESIIPGQKIRSQVDAINASSSAQNIIGTFSAPTKFSIGRRAFQNPSTVLTEGQVIRVAVWSRNLTDKQLFATNVSSNYSPVHFIGDSYLNTGAIQEQVLIRSSDEYIAFSQDGVGGSHPSQQAARFNLTPQFWNSTLIIVDAGGEESEEAYLGGVKSMVENLTHDRWYIIEPQLGAYPAVAEYAGAHMIPTKTLMQSANDGSPEDLQDIANGLWPRSLRSDTVHLNAAGNAVMGEIIYNYVSADGWLP